MREEPINGQRSWSANHEGGQAGEVEQIAFVSGRSELGTAEGDGDKFDGAESEWQMNSEHGNEEDSGHWQSEEGDQAPDEYRKATQNFDEDG